MNKSINKNQAEVTASSIIFIALIMPTSNAEIKHTEKEGENYEKRS